MCKIVIDRAAYVLHVDQSETPLSAISRLERVSSDARRLCECASGKGADITFLFASSEARDEFCTLIVFARAGCRGVGSERACQG